MNKMATRAKNKPKKKNKKKKQKKPPKPNNFTLQLLLNVLANFNQTTQEYC